MKGVTQIAQEGAIQIFQEFNTGMEEIIVGVVGTLQFDVLQFRLQSEYNVEIKLDPLPYEHIRWVANPEECPVEKIVGTSDMKRIKDLKDASLTLVLRITSLIRVVPGLPTTEQRLLRVEMQLSSILLTILMYVLRLNRRLENLICRLKMMTCLILQLLKLSRTSLMTTIF